MNKNFKNNSIRTVVLCLGVFTTSICFAFHGGGGYHHGGGGYYHGHGGGYYHGGGYHHHGGWNGGAWGGWSGPGVAIGIPLGVGGYSYPGSCPRVQVCNNNNHTCWVQESSCSH